MSTTTRTAQLGWWPLWWRQWPLATVLALLFAAETVSLVGGPGELRGWQVPIIGAVAVLAVLAPRFPLGAAIASGGLVAAETVLCVIVEVAGPPLFGGVAVTEMAATMAVLAATIRHAAVRAAAGAAALLVVDVLTATALRPVYLVGPGRVETDLPGLQLAPALLMGLAAGTGLYFRARDRDQVRTLELLIAAARQAERLALARELHDLVAHHVTGILVQAKAARAVADADPAAAQRALPRIESGGAEAMAAMRRLVKALRRAEATEDGVTGFGMNDLSEQTGDLIPDLRRITDRASRPVELSMDLPSLLPPEISASVLRLVAEALTNVEKHAPTARSIQVSIRLEGRTLRLDVVDDGHPTPAPPGGRGYGLVGMQERVTMLDGTLTAGPAEPTGWRVSVELPVAEQPPVEHATTVETG